MVTIHPWLTAGESREKSREFLPSEMAETHAKGISSPEGGSPALPSGGVPSLVTGNGCEILGMKVTAKGQSVILTPPLMLHGKTQKAVNSKKCLLIGALSPQGISASPRGLGWSQAGGSARGDNAPRSRFAPHIHLSLRATSWGPHGPRLNEPR